MAAMQSVAWPCPKIAFCRWESRRFDAVFTHSHPWLYHIVWKRLAKLEKQVDKTTQKTRLWISLDFHASCLKWSLCKNIPLVHFQHQLFLSEPWPQLLIWHFQRRKQKYVDWFNVAMQRMHLWFSLLPCTPRVPNLYIHIFSACPMFLWAQFRVVGMSFDLLSRPLANQNSPRQYIQPKYQNQGTLEKNNAVSTKVPQQLHGALWNCLSHVAKRSQKTLRWLRKRTAEATRQEAPRNFSTYSKDLAFNTGGSSGILRDSAQSHSQQNLEV